MKNTIHTYALKNWSLLNGQLGDFNQSEHIQDGMCTTNNYVIQNSVEGNAGGGGGEGGVSHTENREIENPT